MYNKLDCLNTCIKEICDVFNKRFYTIFSKSFGFRYINKNGNIIIGPYFDQLDFDLLNKYEGIRVSRINENELFDYLQHNVAEKIKILICFDAYFCPWNPAYFKSHIRHYCLVDAMGLDNDTILCHDPFITDIPQFFPIPLFIQGCNEIRQFESCGYSVEITPIKIISEISDDIFCNLNKHPKNLEIEEFASYIENVNDWKLVYDIPDDISLCKLSRLLKYVAYSRNNVGYLLEKTNKDNTQQEIIDICNALYNCEKMWEQVTNTYIKAYYTPSNANKKFISIAEMLRSISAREEMIYENIINYQNVYH